MKISKKINFKINFKNIMSRYLNTFNHLLFGDNDKIKSIYPHVDFNRAVIGGSYALNQYTHDNWTPDDVDIHTTAKDMEDFKEIVAKFCKDTHGTLLKINDFSKGHPHDNEGAAGIGRRDEKFHESIKASATIDVPGLGYEVQYIFIQGLNPQAPVEDQLEPITDLPSCVSYKVSDNGDKKFIVPKKGVEALMTRRIPKKDICPSRMEKYEKRGYHFV